MGWVRSFQLGVGRCDAVVGAPLTIYTVPASCRLILKSCVLRNGQTTARNAYLTNYVQATTRRTLFQWVLASLAAVSQDMFLVYEAGDVVELYTDVNPGYSYSLSGALLTLPVA